MDSNGLRTVRIPGLVATDVIETEQNAAWIFTAAGELLCRLGRAAIPAGTLPGAGPVIVHGDYGPQNLLVDPSQRRITAVVDAEWSRHAPVESEHADAAWFEWIIRFHHPMLVPRLPSFNTGYGVTPGWEERHRLMLRRCAEILDFAQRRDPVSARRWHERLAVTRAFRC